MQDPALDLRANMTPEQQKKMREIIVAMVLATDMTHHFEHVSKFSTKALTCGFDLNDKADRLLVLVMTLKMADISNAYLQGKENDRVILYRIPKDGIPEEGVAGGTVILARVPIYGTADAGRGFWLKLKEVILEQGYSLN